MRALSLVLDALPWASLVLLGASLRLVVRGLTAPGSDPAARLTAAGGAFMVVLFGSRALWELPLGPEFTEWTIRTQYWAVLAAIPTIPSIVASHRRGRKPADDAALAGAILLVTFGAFADGPILEGRLVTQTALDGRVLVALATGPFHPWLGVFAAAAGIYAWYGVRDAKSPSDRDLRLGVRVGALVMVPAGIHDSMLLQGSIASVPLLDVGCTITLVAFSAIFARRARLAHGDARERIEVQTRALRDRQHEILEMERRAALGTLAEGIGHELNNPLTVVAVNVDSLAATLGESLPAGEDRTTVLRDLGEARDAIVLVQQAIADFEHAPILAATPHPRASSLLSAPDSVDTSNRPSARVLIVDDEPGVARALARLLRDHQVTIVHGGAEAVRLARERPFDVVLCDVMMTGLTGADVHDTMMREGLLGACSFAFVTGGAFDPAIAKRVRLAGVPLFEKPVAKSALRAFVASKASPPSAGAASDPRARETAR